MADRFPELSETDLTSLVDQKNSENTNRVIKVAVNVFREYVKERKVDEQSLVSSKDKLRTVLLNNKKTVLHHYGNVFGWP